MTEFKPNYSVMKTLHILALALALVVSPVISQAHETSDSSTTVIAEKIQNTVRLENSDENSRVFVVFSIAENGAVEVHEVGTLDAAVKASITEQFQSMSFDNTTGSYDGTYSIWLNFKSL
jgi:hypothetical protein